MTSEKSKVRVTVSENGPYMVTGDIPLAKQTITTNAEDGSEAWQEGSAVAHRETYALCRCGASQTKPFSDGSHLKTGFVGTETASRDTYLDQAKLLAARSFNSPTQKVSARSGVSATRMAMFGVRFRRPTIAESGRCLSGK